MKSIYYIAIGLLMGAISAAAIPAIAATTNQVLYMDSAGVIQKSATANVASTGELSDNGGFGSGNERFGLQSMASGVPTGNNNSAFGKNSLYALTSGTGNTGVGSQALSSVTTGSYNTAVGYLSLANVAPATNGSTAVGYYTLHNAVGIENTALGYQAGLALTTGYENIAVGFNAMENTTVGATNVAIGADAMYRGNVTGQDNVAIGADDLFKLDGASQRNLGVGSSALQNLTTGDGNVGLGEQAGLGLINGNHNVFLGYRSGVNIAATRSNVVIIGGSDGLTNIGTPADNMIVLSDGAGNIRSFIDPSGNFGIGTSTPAALLHVSAGSNATTTVEFDARDITSKTCFNVRNDSGAATSFYFHGTTMVVEAHYCN